MNGLPVPLVCEPAALVSVVLRKNPCRDPPVTRETAMVSPVSWLTWQLVGVLFAGIVVLTMNAF